MRVYTYVHVGTNMFTKNIVYQGWQIKNKTNGDRKTKFNVNLYKLDKKDFKNKKMNNEIKQLRNKGTNAP